MLITPEYRLQKDIFKIPENLHSGSDSMNISNYFIILVSGLFVKSC